jgi:peptidoglycan/xylan/chitin deacetylase (PgdA/CDA1 family)
LPPSSSRSKTFPEATALPGGAAAISVDVEEWFHNCWIPEYNDPALRRTPLTAELPELLPRLTAELEACGTRATFFVLGEVAVRIAPELRALRSRGHEIACHSFRHLRANDLTPARFFEEIRTAKALLEDLVGAEVRGFRAPEWSLRVPGNPRLRLVAEAGFAYDSSLVRALGAGSPSNPVGPERFTWADGTALVEVPPLTWGGPARLPAPRRRGGSSRPHGQRCARVACRSSSSIPGSSRIAPARDC